MIYHSYAVFSITRRRSEAPETETTASSVASSVAEAVLPACNATRQVHGAMEAAVVTTHGALRGVRNAIDASYVSCQRRLSRRVCRPIFRRHKVFSRTDDGRSNIVMVVSYREM